MNTARARQWLLGLLALVMGCRVLHLPGGYTINRPPSQGDALGGDELTRRIRLPPGFTISRYAAAIANARMLRFTRRGDLLVSAPRQGKVFLITRAAAAPVAGAVRVLLDDLHSPHGIALQEPWLYVAETDAIARVGFDAQQAVVSGGVERIVQDLPGDGRHWTRTIGIGPDQRLYVSIGSSCNACPEKDPRRAAMLRYRLDGSGEEIYASGLRNAVGFAWQPGSGQLYATDNGRDLLGDDFPPCELDRVVAGGFYGWPFFNGDRVPDPDNQPAAAAARESIPPVHAFGAHTAPLGITFYDADRFPVRYRGAAFVALHGSWNRSRKSGYKVVALLFDGNGAIHEEDFAAGFELDDEVRGRPVDVAVGPDGALYVSDDFSGSIYRIAYGDSGTAPSAAAVTPAGGVATDPLAALDGEERQRLRARGAALWNASGCASCHAPGASESYRRLQHLATKYDVGSLVNYLRTPQPPMPAYPFTDEQRRDLAVYLLQTHD